jgi:hypothetical protein
MRTMSADWDDIRERLVPSPAFSGISNNLRNGDDPVVQGLKRFITGRGKAPIADVLYWQIEATESNEKAFRVCLVDGSQFIGTLVPSVVIEGRWVCSEYLPEEQGKGNDLEGLQFVSNVIELKPDKKYLLLFKEINYHQITHLNDYLRSQGLHCICIGTLGQDVHVIEAPNAESKSFWEELGKAMTINERRAIFAKLAEHLGLAVCDAEEEGPTVSTKRFTQEQVNEILGPYIETGDYLA